MPKPASALIMKTMNNEKILIVEDEKKISDIVKSYLESELKRELCAIYICGKGGSLKKKQFKIKNSRFKIQKNNLTCL